MKIYAVTYCHQDKFIWTTVVRYFSLEREKCEGFIAEQHLKYPNFSVNDDYKIRELESETDLGYLSGMVMW